MERTTKTLLLAASVTLVGATAAASAAFASEPAEATLKAFIEAYDRAFNAKDLNRLATFYHADVTIFEGGYVNTGWVDYRDNHLGPELKEMQDLQFAHVEVVPHVLSDGTAYVTAEYRLKTRIEGKPVDAEGLETLVLVKDGEGAWKIRHSHTSGRRKPAAQPSGKP
jgi:ketosteroid isomerase-like protein